MVPPSPGTWYVSNGFQPEYADSVSRCIAAKLNGICVYEL